MQCTFPADVSHKSNGMSEQWASLPGGVSVMISALLFWPACFFLIDMLVGPWELLSEYESVTPAQIEAEHLTMCQSARITVCVFFSLFRNTNTTDKQDSMTVFVFQYLDLDQGYAALYRQ